MENNEEKNHTRTNYINTQCRNPRDIEENNLKKTHERNLPLALMNDDRSVFVEHRLIKYSTPLTPKINQIQYRIHDEILKLLNIFNELKIEDEEVIRKLIISIKENNIQYSSVIYSELNKIRNTCKAILMSKIVLDMLQSQISSISNFNDLVEILTPSISIIKSIRSMLFSKVRSSDLDFRHISDLLIDVVISAGQVGGHLINFKTANSRALAILDNAAFEAEDKTIKEFTPLPRLKI